MLEIWPLMGGGRLQEMITRRFSRSPKINFILLYFIAKVPFPLTLRFKAMLQRGIDLTTLDASWYAV